MKNLVLVLLLSVSSLSFGQEFFGAVGGNAERLSLTGATFRVGVRTVPAGDFFIENTAALEVNGEYASLNLSVVPTVNVLYATDYRLSLGVGPTFLKAHRTLSDSTVAFDMGPVVRATVSFDDENLFSFIERSFISNGYSFLSIGVGFTL